MTTLWIVVLALGAERMLDLWWWQRNNRAVERLRNSTIDLVKNYESRIIEMEGKVGTKPRPVCSCACHDEGES